MPRRPIFLVAANVIGIAAALSGFLLFVADKSSGLAYGTAILAFLIWAAGIALALVLLIVAGLRREGPGWWAYSVTIAVLMVSFLLAFLLASA
jgi:hypothetical protein